MSLPYELQAIVLIALGTLVFVLTLVSLRSNPLLQPGSRVVLALCVSILSMFGLFGVAESEVPEAKTDLNNANGLISGILILYAALAIAMVVMLLLLLLRRVVARAARHKERYGQFHPRSPVSKLKMKQESRGWKVAEPWEDPVYDRVATDLSKRKRGSVSRGITRGAS